MPIVEFDGKIPKVHPSVFIAPNAYVIGDVEIGPESSVFFGAVIRGDIQPIRIGERSNVQEHVVLHTSRGLGPCILENEVTVGHGAVLHGCHVKDQALIGMQATVLDESIIEQRAVVAAHALIKVGMNVPSGKMAAGVPAKIRGEVSEEVWEFTKTGIEHYVKVSKLYKAKFSSEESVPNEKA